jgi:hypothetical protein
MHDLSNFDLAGMTSCGAALRRIGVGASSMEEVAGRIVRYFHDEFVDPRSRRPELALVRFFKTIEYRDLDPDLKQAVRRLMDGDRRHDAPGGGEGEPPSDLKVLTLLASAGDKPEWNDRRRSARHRAIPLASGILVARFPMIGRLITQCGLDLAVLMMPGKDIMIDAAQKTFNVFHIFETVGSPYVPDQEDFVLPSGIHSVVGFGGLLPPRDFFATILFSRTPVARDIANEFAPLALSMKLALLPYTDGPVFE